MSHWDRAYVADLEESIALIESYTKTGKAAFLAT
jgi:hypothetical protein